MMIALQARRYLKIGWRHRWKGLLLAWIASIGGIVAVQALPDQYRSSARIYADADAILGQALRGITVDGATAAQVDTLQRTLLSRPNLERVIARTDLDLRVSSQGSREALLKDLSRSIRISPQTRNLFQLEYTDRDPRLAQAVVQTTMNLFMEMAASNDRQQMENARSFIAQQIATYETQLRESEQRRADFRTRYVDLLPNDTLGGASRLEASRGRLNQLRGEMQDAQVRRNLTRQQLDATPATLTEGTGAPAVEEGGGRLAQAEQQLRDLRLRYTDQHPEVAMMRATIADLRNGGETKPARPRRGGMSSRPNPAREQLQARLIDTEAQVVSLDRQVRDATTDLERLESLARGAPQLQAQYQNLDRDYNVLRKQYEELLERRESVQIAGAARVGADQMRIEVVEPPTVPTLPSGPHRLALMCAVLVASIGAGVLLTAAFTVMDQSFHSLEDLRRFGIPVLGAVSGPKAPRRAVPVIVFAGSFALLFVVFGAVLVGEDILTRRVQAIVTRVLA